MTAAATSAPASRVHGGAFPHPVDCRECHHEHRCPICGNSKGYGRTAMYRHGPGRCEPITAPAPIHSELAERTRDRAETWLLERIAQTRHSRPVVGACGFATIDDMRAFARTQAQRVLGFRPLSVMRQMALESAVRSLFPALAYMCSVIERPATEPAAAAKVEPC